VHGHVVSIRTPRAGRDVGMRPEAVADAVFLSARPGRGATGADKLGERYALVSIRTPRAGRDLKPCATGTHWRVSIRTPRAGRDSVIVVPLL